MSQNKHTPASLNTLGSAPACMLYLATQWQSVVSMEPDAGELVRAFMEWGVYMYEDETTLNGCPEDGIER